MFYKSGVLRRHDQFLSYFLYKIRYISKFKLCSYCLFPSFILTFFSKFIELLFNLFTRTLMVGKVVVSNNISLSVFVNCTTV